MTAHTPSHSHISGARRTAWALVAALALCLLGAASTALAQTHGHDNPAGDSFEAGGVGDQVGGHVEDTHHGDPTAHWNLWDIGYASKNVYGEPLEKGDEPMSPPFALMIFNFALVVAILMWKPRHAIKKYTAKRHDEIKAALAEAGRLRDEARAKLDEYTAQIDQAEKDIDTMVSDIRKTADAEKQRILEEAEAQAEAMKRDADQRISAELERARTELEREVVNAAIAVATRLLREHTSKSDQTQLVDTFINDVQADAARTESAQ
ncbi:ATP synthase F0 subunit B [Haliangium ochraceum]|uniref:ATP synthase subunit b n=1 Tax=Haliangium ochraceum (strain DSM 14365 / JCM 11303 / SMP-2) TaxID=502025 RepID=D0LL45_HALO1|nr:ATP synthase F0 subunit B [Haliangium ochraceum]ACY18541.1 H+transporting two-sector ATPase B/B' subunit [Haliangium ochraceum DSM 14365]